MKPDELADALRAMRRVGAEPTSIEVKNGLGGPPKSVTETLVAFSNGEGGTLIVGVDESAGFQPVVVDDLARHRDTIVAVSRDAITPPLQISAEFVDLDGVDVLVVEVPPVAADLRPAYVTSRGVVNGAYLRTGDGDRRMSQGEIAIVVSSRTQPTYDREPVEASSLDELDASAVSRYLQRVRAGSPALRPLSDRDTLQRVGVLGRDGRLSLAGLLAFGTFPQERFPQLMVSFVAYPADRSSDLRFLDNATIRGSIADMVSETLVAIRRHLVARNVMTGFGREERLDFPLAAVREAVVNALLHRDYGPTTRGTQVQVELHPDRLCVRSPGGLFGGVTVDDLGAQGISSSRNALLASVLSDVYLPQTDQLVAENRASGIPTMVSAARTNGLPPPLFDSTVVSFLATMGRSELLGPEVRAWLRSLRLDLPSPMHEIATAMMRADHVTNATLREWGADRIEAGQVLRDLVERGVAVRSGGRRFARYVLDPEVRPTPGSAGRGPNRAGTTGHPSRSAVLRSLRERGGATSAEVEVDTGLRRGAVLRWLNLLIDSGEVRAIAPARSRLRRYELDADSTDASR